MSKENKASIDQAEAIIEKFGGIRPMAAKTNVAVTTIQGWKKRGVIPATRKKMLIEAAQAHAIDISDYVPEAKAFESVIQEPVVEQNIQKEEASVEITREIKITEPPAKIKPDQNNDLDVPDTILPKDQRAPRRDEFGRQNTSETYKSAVHPEYTELVIESERKAVTKSVLIAASFFVAFLGLLAVMLWPHYEAIEQRDSRISELEQELLAIESDLTGVKQQQSNFKGLVPQDWSQQLEELKLQAEGLKDRASEVSQYVRDETNLDERVEQLQTYVSEVVSQNGLYGSLMPRFEGLQESYAGRSVLERSVDALLPVFAQAQGQSDDQINVLIDHARSQNEALQQTIGAVPKEELKAAALLLAMTEVRGALNRSEEAFEGDLQLLMGLVGDENPDLNSALEKIAPHAKSGVLSAGGLRTEFQTVAGDVVAASLRGEEVSFSEKLSARFNDILKVEKEGELITGTETQVKVQKAQKLIEDNRWEDALAYLQKNLRAKELDPLKPWIKKVEASLSARDVQRALEKAIDLNFGDGLLGGSELLQE